MKLLAEFRGRSRHLDEPGDRAQGAQSRERPGELCQARAEPLHMLESVRRMLADLGEARFLGEIAELRADIPQRLRHLLEPLIDGVEWLNCLVDNRDHSP